MDKVADMDVMGDMDGCRGWGGGGGEGGGEGWGEWGGHRGYGIFFEKGGLIQKKG